MGTVVEFKARASKDQQTKNNSHVEYVVCKGDHREMGRIQGCATTATLSNLHSALSALAGASEDSFFGQRFSPFLLNTFGRGAQFLLERDLKRYYPEQYARTKGIAEGAGIPVSHLFAGPAVEILLNNVSYVSPGACSAVLVTGKKSSTGEPIIAKNFDYPSFAKDQYLVRRSEPSNFKIALDVGAAPMSGSHEGVNEDGLAIAYNYGHFSGESRARVSITNLVQEMLERCSTVGEAIAYLHRAPRIGGAILMLADAAGDGASVEVAPDFLGVRKTSANSGALAHTNHALTDEMIPRDIPKGAVLSNWYPKAMRGLPIQKSSLKRYTRAEELLGGAESLGESELISIISDHNGGSGDDNSICRHGPFYRTTASILLFPKRRSMKVVFGSPCETAFREFAL